VRKLVPPASGDEQLFEKTDSKVLFGDICNYEIALPATADTNDVLTFKMEYIKGGIPTLLQGKTFDTATRKYTPAAG
jgi:hypothetical protein